MASSLPELPDWARGLRAPLPLPYVYRSPLKRALAGALDAAGDRWVAVRPSPAVDWARQRRVAVLRLDHLGDLLNALPALRRLRSALPQAELELWVGPWGRDLAALFADVDAVRVTAAPWFERPQRRAWPWASLRGLARALRTARYDAAFDLRGDLRHHLALWSAGIPVRAGLALSAGRFLLSHPARWRADLHEQEQALSLLDQAGVPRARASRRPYLRRDPAGEREAAALAGRLRLGRKALLVQAAAGTQAKRWPLQHWTALFKRLPRDWQVVLLGSPVEREEMQALARAADGRPQVAAGALGLSGLAAFLRRGRLLLSVDSGPAHLAALQGLPIVSLYSATNRALQWAPRGAAVTLLRAPDPPCSPCELSACPFDNACMRALTPETVLRSLREAWKRTR